MIVTMQIKDHSITGIRIGRSDSKRTLPPGIKKLDLQLDDLRIQCDLQAGTGRARAEISDPRLAAWLQEKFYWQKLPLTPVPLELVKSGHSYRLQLLAASSIPKAAFGLTV